MRRRARDAPAVCPDRRAELLALLDGMTAGRVPLSAGVPVVLELDRPRCPRFPGLGACGQCSAAGAALWRWELMNDHRPEVRPVLRALAVAVHGGVL